MKIDYTIDKGEIIKTTTPDPIVEKIDLSDFDKRVQTCTEQIQGFQTRKDELAQQDADMDAKITAAQQQIDSILAEKTKILKDHPELEPKVSDPVEPALSNEEAITP